LSIRKNIFLRLSSYERVSCDHAFSSAKQFFLPIDCRQSTIVISHKHRNDKEYQGYMKG